LLEAVNYLRLCCVVDSAGGWYSSSSSSAALPIRQVDAFTDVIGFASASLTAVLFLLNKICSRIHQSSRFIERIDRLINPTVEIA